MSQYSKERNGTYLGDPTQQGRASGGKDNGSKAGKSATKGGLPSLSFKTGPILKGIPSHDDSSFPKAGRGSAANFKELRNSTIGQGSI